MTARSDTPRRTRRKRPDSSLRAEVGGAPRSSAEDAAIASRCACQQGNDKFWLLYDGLFSKQGEITRENFKGTVTTLAAASGLDPGRFGACLEGKATLDAVKADQAEATSLGVNSTPTFFINGRRLSGAQTYDSFKQMIEQELADKG